MATVVTKKGLVVRSGVPVPPLVRRGGAPKSEFSRTLIGMRIGDCVDVPVTDHQPPNLHQAAGRHGVRIKVRKIEGKNGTDRVYRVWKVANIAPKRFERKR